MKSWYPLRGMPKQGQIWSWISFDVANQSFTLLINTVLFSIFFSRVVVNDPARDDILWSVTFAISMLLTVIASPIAGAIADDRAWKKAALLITGFSCAAMTCALALIPPGAVWLAMLIYIPANFMFSIGENFLGSFLPELAKREKFGLLSAFSWGCAYFSALVLLVLTAAAMMLFDLKQPDQWRPFFVFAGLWFFVFAIPTLLYLREQPAPKRTGPRENLLLVGFTRLARTAREVGRFRDLAILLLASLFYGTAMSVVILFASLLAKEFGFADVQLIIFTAVITVSGIVGTLIPMAVQDRFGHRRTTIALLLLWLVTALGLAWMSWAWSAAPDKTAFPRWPMWLFGNLLGLGLGSLGSANRAFVGYLTPPARSAEFFGLWGLVFKLAAVGTVPFAVVKDTIGTTASLLVLAGFVVVGLVITLFVNEQRGAAAAREGGQATEPTPTQPPTPPPTPTGDSPAR
jgi:UMF1 family MFS transporter